MVPSPLGYSSYGNNNMYLAPDDLRDKVWEELNERKQNKRCARCGTTTHFYIKEKTKYIKYDFISNETYKDGSLDEEARISGSHICTKCGKELTKGLLGDTSKQIEPTNEKHVRTKYAKIIALCGIRDHLQHDLHTCEHQLYKIKSVQEDPDVIQLRMKQKQEEIDLLTSKVKDAESEMDDLNNMYMLK